MKKLFFVPALLAVFILTGCGSKYTDGTYTGSSMAGMHGEFAVEITVHKGKITQLKSVVNNETEGIGTKVVDQLFAQVLKEQNHELDAVSGASKTSAAVIEAVTEALRKAGE